MKSVALRHLARLYGIQSAYYDVRQRLVVAEDESFLGALAALRVRVERSGQVADLAERRRHELWSRIVEPVVVAWDGKASASVRLPQSEAEVDYECRLDLEDGRQQVWSGNARQLTLERTRRVGDRTYVRRRMTVPFELPHGYHRLTVTLGPLQAEAVVIAAPSRAYQLSSSGRHKSWGVFVPLYALHGKDSWGCGDFSDLARLIDWTSRLGGDLVATLPLLAWHAEVSEDPSPYSPASRLFWNDFYIDVTSVSDFAENAAARQLVESPEFQEELAAVRSAGIVDYHRQMRLKRQILMLLSQNLSPNRMQELQEFCDRHPEVDEYARFRAVGEARRSVWLNWPERLQEGRIEATDYEDAIFQYHRYVHWQVESQLQSLSADARRRQMLWYLDFALGVGSAGYDTWRYRELFAMGASGGAPPDSFFTKGQNWGFPPLHPETIRSDGYRYLIQSIRRHLQHARLLRIDHAMGLHRLYWIPDGLPPDKGVYVRYRTEELFAVLCVESHRYEAQIIGENLGTVPAALDSAMQRHGIHEMYVVQYECHPETEPPLRTVPAAAIASLNTHDMPTFSAFWHGLDIEDRVDLGLLTQDEAHEEMHSRDQLRTSLSGFLQGRDFLRPDGYAEKHVLSALLQWLAAGQAEVVLVSLEDLWGETEPQNTPGTYLERCNWRRKARFSFDEFQDLPAVEDLLQAVDLLRQGPINRGDHSESSS